MQFMHSTCLNVGGSTQDRHFGPQPAPIHNVGVDEVARGSVEIDTPYLVGAHETLIPREYRHDQGEIGEAWDLCLSLRKQLPRQPMLPCEGPQIVPSRQQGRFSCRLYHAGAA